MKGKFRKILGLGLALALVLSLSLVMAVPVAADPGDEVEFVTAGTGTAEWSATQQLQGNYSAKLTCPDSGLNEWSAARVPYGETLATLDGLGYDTVGVFTVFKVKWSIWYDVDSGTRPYSMLWIDEDADGIVDSRLTGGFGVADPALGTDEQWSEARMRSGTAWQLRDYDAGVISTYSGEFSGTPDSFTLDTYLDDPDCVNAIASYIGYGYTNTATAAYVDDIIIDGVTYAVEPPLPPMDEDFYSVGGEPTVTIYDGAANTDSMAIDTIDSGVHVDSTTDTVGDDLELTETGADTGKFTGSFTLLGEAPADRELDQIVIDEGDTITLTYLGLSDTALVDDTAPEITIGSPTDGQQIEDTMPEIKATYEDTAASGSASGIDTDSVEIIVDDVDVTEEDATLVSNTEVTYTPTEDLDDGSHDVIVNVSDLAGNAAATASWSFSVVSWLEDSYDSTTGDSLDCLTAFGVGVFNAGETADIALGRYTSNPETAPTFTTIENGFFDVKVTGADTSQIVIKFADDNITADSVAYVWSELDGVWLECDDQYYNPTAEYLRVKVRDDTIPNIAELEGTPFAISGEPAVDILDYYQGADGIVSTSELLTAITDWAAGTIPSGFTEALTTSQLLTLITEWAS